MPFCFNKVFSQSAELERIAHLEGEDAFEELKRVYWFDTLQAPQLYHLVLAREKRKIFSMSNNDDIKVRVTVKHDIEQIYQDSINAILIPYNPKISGKIISNALRLADKINLSIKKKDILMGYALDFAHRLREDPYAYILGDEINVLKNNLTSEQLNTIIDDKNKDQAYKKALNVWSVLKKAGETEDLDSTSQVVRAEMYYTLELRYHDLFIGHEDMMWQNLNDLYRNKPKVIKMFDALGTNNIIKEKVNKKEKHVDSTFSW
jgi:hypothetical protein